MSCVSHFGGACCNTCKPIQLYEPANTTGIHTLLQIQELGSCTVLCTNNRVSNLLLDWIEAGLLHGKALPGNIVIYNWRADGDNLVIGIQELAAWQRTHTHCSILHQRRCALLEARLETVQARIEWIPSLGSRCKANEGSCIVSL